jgi:3-oxoacyl-[acyl-carrier protein] reductase
MKSAGTAASSTSCRRRCASRSRDSACRTRSRAAVAGWAKTLSGELARFGITVNNVLPGYTKTAALDAIIAGRAEGRRASGRGRRTRHARAGSAGRFAESWEVAAAIGFPGEPAGGYITGVSLPVDGGRIASL